MKASYFELSGPRVLSLRTQDLDDQLLPEQIVASTEFSAISTGTELAAWLGRPPLRPSTQYPRLVGYCNVAEVVAVGDGTDGLTVGDYILTHQSHRTAFRCSAGDVLISVRDADPLERKILAVTYLYHLGYSALLRANYVPGHAVAIIGFGALGLVTTQLVAAFSGAPIVFSSRQRAIVDDLPRRTESLPKGSPGGHELSRLTGMDGVDIVVNTSDAWDDYLLAQQVIRAGGTIVCLGFPGRGLAPPTFNPLDSQYFYDKQLSIRHCGHTPVDGAPIDVRFSLKRNMRYLFGLLRNGLLDASPLVRYESPFGALDQVYERLAAPTRTEYSAIIRWRD